MVSRTTSRCANSASLPHFLPHDRESLGVQDGDHWAEKNHRVKLTGLQLVPIMMLLLLSGCSPALPVDTHMFRPLP